MRSEWFNDESFWIETYPHVFPEQSFEAADQEVEQILALANFSGDSVLDLCCGPGRHSIPLAERGMEVTGVDASSFLLTKAKERAEAKQVRVEWVREDMRRFARPHNYDLVLNLFSSFGYFDDRDDDLKVLTNIYQSLKQGGSLLLDLMGKEWLARNIQPCRADQAPDGSIRLDRPEVFDDWTRVKSTWTLIKGETARTFQICLSLYSGQELRTSLEEAGFAEVQLFGDLEGGQYGLRAKRLIGLAHKR